LLLKSIDPQLVKEDTPFRKDVKFAKKLVSYLFLFSQERSCNPNFSQDLLSLLNCTRKGQNVLASYGELGQFTFSRRSDLMFCIVEYFYSHSVYLQFIECRAVARKIVDLFPTENVKTYIQKNAESKVCGGKLYYKSQNMLKKIKKLGFNIFAVNK
jgi:hypothetical protein